MFIMKACLFLILVFQANEIYGVCNLSLKNDFANPPPVYIRNGKFLAPNMTGEIILRHSESLEIACPGSKKVITVNNTQTSWQYMNVTCVKDTTFRSNEAAWEGNLNEIKCNEPPWYTAENTGERCYRGHQMYRIGYKIRDKFLSVYEACFDRYLVNTVYIKQELSPVSRFTQGGRRPQFTEGEENLFNKISMSKVYKIENQNARFETILGPGMSKKYLTKKQFLNRGHLAPRADFPLLAEQRASFHYINTAPQWMRGNAGDWAALEDALRRRIHSYASTVTVYTGTHGVSTLVDSRDVHRELFLEVDANNNGVVPIPLYFYKVVHDPKKRTAVAFISINSSYYNTSLTNQLSFCEDICTGNKQYNWLKWRSNDGTHSFCCTYEDFRSKIDSLPLLKVTGLFY